MKLDLPPAVLFLGNNATRTGAVLFLLYLVRWLAANNFVRPVVALRGGGALQDEFAALGPVFRTDSKKGLPPATLPDIRLIYANTALHARWLADQSDLPPFILHLHEMEHELRKAGVDALRRAARRAAAVVACSRSCARDFARVADLPEGDILVLPEMITDAGTGLQEVADAGSLLLSRVGFPASSPVICGSGMASWRKGTDLFLSMARALSGRLPQARFLWIGGFVCAEEEKQFQYDLRKSGMDGLLHVTGEVQNPLDWMRCADVFCLTSREDPYPLVMLEAAALGLPVFGFRGSGGIEDFAGTGYSVALANYADAQGLADGVWKHLATDRGARHEPDSSHGIAAVAPRFGDLIGEHLSGRSWACAPILGRMAEGDRISASVSLAGKAVGGQASVQHVFLRHGLAQTVHVSAPQTEAGLRLVIATHAGEGYLAIDEFRCGDEDLSSLIPAFKANSGLLHREVQGQPAFLVPNLGITIRSPELATGATREMAITLRSIAPAAVSGDSGTKEVRPSGAGLFYSLQRIFSR